MVMYTRRWDGVAALPVLEDPSEEQRLERELQLSDINVDKARLEQDLPAKRSARRAQEEFGQWSNRISNMKGPAFQACFGRKKTADAVREVVREREEELARDELAVVASKKRKSALAAEKTSSKKIKTTAAVQSEPTPSVASTPASIPAAEPAQDLEMDLDAEGETDDEDDELSQLILKGFEEEEPAADDSETPALATSEDPEASSRKEESPDEKISEHATALISILNLAPREENTVTEFKDEVKRVLEASSKDEATSEQDTAPASPLATPQQDSAVAIVEEHEEEEVEDDLDDLFDDNENVPGQVATPAMECTPQAEAIPEELAATASADWELVEAGIHYAAVLAKKQAEITQLEQSITNGVTHRNLLFRARAEKSRSTNEAKLRELKDEYVVLEQLSRDEVFQMWEAANADAIQRRRQYNAEKAVKSVPKKKEAGSCGGSKMNW
ncbi:uncharacterized protein EKO05_0007640 [Ascochyta rabiei]|uniref:uncharacterized protein n=1 Tax=Didymella rabiei TaxID=5454 RepID=UPI00220B0642|nr:uncharacterized protein EKO05_0007640 [Ascochyta rabiei]UPX17274.1 hypothetical protein EKO05_0007640 [Ascochyta rabiei]